MKTTTIILIVVISLILLNGCTTQVQRSTPQYFIDTGNEVDNFRECHRLAKSHCDSNRQCKGYEINIIKCEGGECYCD